MIIKKFNNKMSQEEVGYIYCVSNPMFPVNDYKIGCTKNIKERLNSLSNTSLYEPFNLEFCKLVKNYKQCEQNIHKSLDKYRIKKNREFFNVDINIIKKEFDKYTEYKNYDYKSAKQKLVDFISTEIIPNINDCDENNVNEKLFKKYVNNTLEELNNNLDIICSQGKLDNIEKMETIKQQKSDFTEDMFKLYLNLRPITIMDKIETASICDIYERKDLSINNYVSIKKSWGENYYIIKNYKDLIEFFEYMFNLNITNMIQFTHFIDDYSFIYAIYQHDVFKSDNKRYKLNEKIKNILSIEFNSEIDIISHDNFDQFNIYIKFNQHKNIGLELYKNKIDEIIKKIKNNIKFLINDENFNENCLYLLPDKKIKKSHKYTVNIGTIHKNKENYISLFNNEFINIKIFLKYFYVMCQRLRQW
jgi:hypothetical protein